MTLNHHGPYVLGHTRNTMASTEGSYYVNRCESLRATRTLSTQLSGAQVGITLTTILLGYTTQSALAGLLEDLLGSAGLAWGLATGIAAFAAAVCVNVFSMLFGELIPKNFALAHPLATAVRVVPFQMAFTAVARQRDRKSVV